MVSISACVLERGLAIYFAFYINKQCRIYYNVHRVICYFGNNKKWDKSHDKRKPKSVIDICP
jgi:hypothetical protein